MSEAFELGGILISCEMSVIRLEDERELHDYGRGRERVRVGELEEEGEEGQH